MKKQSIIEWINENYRNYPEKELVRVCMEETGYKEKSIKAKLAVFKKTLYRKKMLDIWYFLV
jgi:hypothetical protein